MCLSKTDVKEGTKKMKSKKIKTPISRIINLLFTIYTFPARIFMGLHSYINLFDEILDDFNSKSSSLKPIRKYINIFLIVLYATGLYAIIIFIAFSWKRIMAD